MKTPINVLIASDSFKGSLSSLELANVFSECAKGLSGAVNVHAVAIADGGEGTLEALASSGDFHTVSVVCRDPLFRDVTANYVMDDGGRAIIEMAQASGLTLIPYEDGNAGLTTTFGTGQLIADALVKGAKQIFVSAGGSATNDGGMGALAALGYAFLDEDGRQVIPIGYNLERVASIETTHALDTSRVSFTILADVDNPLVGERGATRFYGRQKGAVGEIMDNLERGMQSYADVVERETGVRLHDMPHAGAAGGLAGGLIALLGAKVMSGIDAVLSLVDFADKLKNTDVVVTGEGRLDFQSAHGKAVSGVCREAHARDIPVYAIAGCSELSPEDAKLLDLKAIKTLREVATSSEDSIRNAASHAKTVAKLLLQEIVAREAKD